MFFRFVQEKESSTFTYILADESTRRAVIIDPVIEDLDKLKKLFQELRLHPAYSLETHVHADHVTAAAALRKEFGTKLVVGKMTGVQNADMYLDHEQELRVDGLTIKALYTPGHTDGDTCYLCENHLFTGDALLIRGCGRTDFQSGSSERLFHSIKNILYRLPDETIVHPGHDYKGNFSSSIGEEKNHNARIRENTTLEEFVATMAGLKLDYPKKIDVSLPRNKLSGE